MNTMLYKEYAAQIEYSNDDGCFIGHIAGIDDVVGFHGEHQPIGEVPIVSGSLSSNDTYAKSPSILEPSFRRSRRMSDASFYQKPSNSGTGDFGLTHKKRSASMSDMREYMVPTMIGMSDSQCDKSDGNHISQSADAQSSFVNKPLNDESKSSHG